MSDSAATLAAVSADMLIFVDDVSPRLRGWAFDRANPGQPARLRFRIDGRVVWEGTCNDPRPDVKDAGYPTELVGFSFEPVDAVAGGMLTIETLGGAPLVMMDGREARSETLVPAVQHIAEERVQREPPHVAHAGTAPGTVRHAVSAKAFPGLTPRATVPSVRQESPRLGFLFGLFRRRRSGAGTV